MMKRFSNHMSLAAVDGLIALAIAVFIVTPKDELFAVIKNLYVIRVRLIDSTFGFAFIFAWQYAFSVLNLYDKFATVPSRMSAILKGVTVMIIPMALHLLFFHPRLLTVKAVVLVVAFQFAYEINRLTISAYLLDRFAARDPRRAVILGSGRRAGKAWREIRTRYHSSIAMLGFVDTRDPNDMAPDVATRYLGTVDQLGELLLGKVVDVLLIAMPIKSCYPLMQEAVNIAEGVGVQVIYLEDIYSSRKRNEDTNGTLFRELAPQQEQYLMQLAAKRFVDVCGSVIGLILLAPLLGVIALALKLTSDGPVFFTQDRFGHRRRVFKIIKFRTMVPNAEQLIGSLELANDAVGPIFKMNNDPRITRFGRLLRRASFDELPQLWNVLRGEMSLVGPRPMTIRDVSVLSNASLMRRFSVKPGITGLMQIDGISASDVDDWIEMDSSYIDRWSLLLDLRIMLRTVSTVIRRSGVV